MKSLLTPKQVASAIQVSESSVKRWCDKGVISTQYTAGGHRRIPTSAVMDFLRTTKHGLAHPEVIGLPAATGKTERFVDRAHEHFRDGLVAGSEDGCRQIVLDLYLAAHSISQIFDLVIAPSFEHIGRLWQCGEAEVYQERRACEICLRVLHEIRSFVPTPALTAPLAIGGAVEGDRYGLATTMAETVLRQEQWNATSLGIDLPFATLKAAIREQRPRLFWLSVSHIEDTDGFLRGYLDLYTSYGACTAIVVGGRALTETIRHEMRYAAYCDNMQHLESFSQTLLVTAQTAAEGSSE